MTTLNCNVTPGKVFTPDGAGIVGVRPSGLNQLGIPTVTVPLDGAVGAEDIAAGAVTAPKLAEMSVDGLQAARVARATYSFVVHGGAIGAIDLGVTLPIHAVITRSWYRVVTALTSGGAATMALHVEAANDILSAVVLGTAGAVGFREGISDGTAANYKATTAARALTLTIGTATLLTGKLILFVEYVVTE